MSKIVDLAEFSSEAFGPFLPEACQVNPGAYGAELAYWLSRALAESGVPTSYPDYEDWGWYLTYVTDGGSEFAVHCGNITGASSRWLLSLRRYGRKIFDRDPPPFSDAAELVAAIERCLEAEASISDLEWVYAGSVE